MPAVTVHVQLARRVLEQLARTPRAAPFDPLDPMCANAFYHGSFGPDLGYMPGGHRPISDLAHCLGSGDLTRALIRHADSAIERAFAWGWVTHVLADAMIHPIVGCAVGELVYGTPARFAAGDGHPIAHVRVEAGLDALYAERHPELRRWSFRPVFDHLRIRTFAAAFSDVHGVSPEPQLLLNSHVIAGRRAGQGLGLAAFTARHLPTHVRPLRAGLERARGPVSWLRHQLGQRGVVLGYMLPALPPLWFIDAVRDVEDHFVEMFLEELELGFERLPNVNLDTGRPEFEDPDHGGLRRSLAYVSALRNPVVEGAA